MTEDTKSDESRRHFLKSMALGSAVMGASAVAPGLPLTKTSGAAKADGHAKQKMAFIQWQPHTVPNAWSKGIEEVLNAQEIFDYQLLDGQNKVEVQVSLMDTLINDGASVIFLQPIDSVALAPSIASAKRRGISVITLNIDATEEHAAHVEMNHYFGAKEIARVMGEKMGGTGEVAIMNAPPGIIIRDQRTNGFVEGMAEYHPGISIVADVNAEWSRQKAQDALNTVLASNPNVTGVYGVNDSMALGAVDVAKQKGILDQMTIFGNDGERDALESIEAGELTGTQYTDVYQQGRFAASAATVMATGGISARDFQSQGTLLMPYIIATAENVGGIQEAQRW
ncbi:substrate-binding protein domain-containing protein [Aliiroseovarius halocynthiae]|uniref:Substrate-binding domain-containing protein n=1 Tax=Aliiroseovarius halocynthiae TaxID=985055 RepID=A0A545SN96_9RHOB|nr:sugar ABC transporter substrate-binding protein [Aliiroseovarius halocynthiae]TQV66460.1 substrate-binding domain-containing protein [Aliiroseovarius halocynthiae]SMR83612.1 substrate-binding protein domain-containing protein [Aliiroseovarius halocynthiae]